MQAGFAMPLVGLKEAARLTGKNQSTIHRAMKSGRLSFTVSDGGERVIETAELDRVFQVSPDGEHARKDVFSLQSHVEEIARLRMQLEAEHERLAVSQERLGEKDAMIADLREDRDKWRTQAETLLLTDQREQTARRSWWRFGKR
jgi:hypothetical protein